MKFSLFNVCVISAFLLLLYLFRLPNLMEEFGELGKYGVWGLLVLGNITFAVYDFALSRVILTYLNWFRPRFLKRHS